MREQVVTQKVGSRAGFTKRSTGVQQRPARRSGRESNLSFADRMRSAARYFPFFGKVAVTVVFGLLVFAGYRAAASATFFQVRHVEVKGTARASSDQVQQVVRHELAQTGVWQGDLTALSSQLEHLPWVRTAVVSRLLPDGIRVRITERVQRAVIRTAAGRLVWVDDDAVMLGELAPTDQMPNFFLRGWSEENTKEARLENRERVEKYLELQREWDRAGLSERVSEVNLIDTRDIRAQLAGDDSQIEVRLGSEDAGSRLSRALEVLDEQRSTPRGGLIRYLDLSQGKRVYVGVSSGKQLSVDSALPAADVKKPETNREPAAAKPTRDKAAPDRKDTRAAKRTAPGNSHRPRAD